MRRSPVALVPAAVGLLLAACTGDRDSTIPRSAPESALLTAPSAPALSCSFSNIRSDARVFFSSGSDVAFDIIRDMSNAYGSGGAAGAAAATPFGLNLFREIAAARLTSRQATGTSAAGGTLVRDAALCMNLGPVDPTTAAKALASGIFEVRGGTLPTVNPADPINAAIAKPDVYPRWGVEPRIAGAWSTAYSRYLIYGTPGAATSELGGEIATVGTFTGFEVSSLPADFDKTSLRVGICVNALIGDSASNSRSGVNLLIHKGVVQSNSSLSTTFCDGAPLPPSASLSTSAWFASIANRITSVFRPGSLFAQEKDLDFTSFTGGGPSSWSPHVFGQFTGSNIALTFTTQPKNGTAFVTLDSFVVHAATIVPPPALGHVLKGVDVTISVANNSGTPAGACVAGTLTITTDSLGNAVFKNVTVKKAGGYTVTASGVYQTVPTLSKVSDSFNIKNKKGDTACP